MEYLVGEFERSIDGNSRMTLPSSIADHFNGEAVVTDDPEGCVRISISAAFQQRVDELMDKFRRGELSRDQLRAESAPSRVVKIDKQGRLTIDEESRGYSGIEPGTEVMVVGTFDSIEIWRPSRYAMKKREEVVVQPRRVWEDGES